MALGKARYYGPAERGKYGPLIACGRVENPLLLGKLLYQKPRRAIRGRSRSPAPEWRRCSVPDRRRPAHGPEFRRWRLADGRWSPCATPDFVVEVSGRSCMRERAASTPRICRSGPSSGKKRRYPHVGFPWRRYGWGSRGTRSSPVAHSPSDRAGRMLPVRGKARACIEPRRCAMAVRSAFDRFLTKPGYGTPNVRSIFEAKRGSFHT